MLDDLLENAVGQVCGQCETNAHGLTGPAACGLLGFGLADSIYAEKVIVVTDNLVPFPCIPWQIQGNNVDFVVEVDSIGDPTKIVSGTTRVTRSPDRLRIAELAAGAKQVEFSADADAAARVGQYVDFTGGASGTHDFERIESLARIIPSAATCRNQKGTTNEHE